MKVKTGLGIDSHRFVSGETDRPLMLGGVAFKDAPALEGNSDADVILHALTDAISGVTGVTVIGAVADALCREGVTDSVAYLERAIATLKEWELTHVSIALECLRPKIDSKVSSIQANLAKLLKLSEADVCITATTGEGLTAVGRGEGIHATVIVTAVAS